MKHLLIAALTLAVPLAARADEVKKADDMPIKAKLIAKKATYTLDLGGKTAEEYRKMIADGEKTGKVPPAPDVDLELELTNTSTKDIQLWKNGDPVMVTIDLQGKGAVSAKPMLAFTADFRVPSPMTLAPGKSFTVPVKSLRYGFRGASQMAYWTEPGEYTIKASFVTGTNPPPTGVKPNDDGFGKATFTSEPVKITVEEKK